MLQNEIISSFHQAREPGVTQAPLGPDLRYIGKLPILNKINNFEEEYLLKGDKIVNRWYGMDEDSIPCYRETIEYRTKNDSKNYYELQYYEYDLRPENQDVTVVNDVMKINVHTKLENLPTTSGIIRRRYDLYFVKDSNTKELFSSKTVESRIIEVNDNDHAGGRRQVEIIKHDIPMQSNVIFENGQFNTQRMKAGFNLDNNILTAQSVYSTANYSNGIIAIEGHFQSQIAAEDGCTFATLGTNSSYLINQDQYLYHAGDATIDDDNIDGCCYFIPINFEQLNIEDYDTINFKFDQDLAPAQVNRSSFSGYIYETDGNNQLHTRGGGGERLETSGEYNLKQDLGGSGLNYVPIYVSFRLTHGTYHIKKIWFSKEH